MNLSQDTGRDQLKQLTSESSQVVKLNGRVYVILYIQAYQSTPPQKKKKIIQGRVSIFFLLYNT